jgi:murein DD-endopeptidase MepM/ murein hydrolase activator NlpD
MITIEDLKKLQSNTHPVVPFDFSKEPFKWLNLSSNNEDIFKFPINENALLDGYIDEILYKKGIKVGVGGYAEERAFYKLSPNFHTTDTPRSIHLGIDIWAKALTPVFAVMDGKVHSFQDNRNFGDYGGTIILQHDFDKMTFYTLYGHLSVRSLENLYEGKPIKVGEQIATFGIPQENGNWSPHLHFQIITDMLGKKGDFYGVATKSEKDYYLSLCPNPNILLKIPENQNIRI